MALLTAGVNSDYVKVDGNDLFVFAGAVVQGFPVTAAVDEVDTDDDHQPDWEKVVDQVRVISAMSAREKTEFRPKVIEGKKMEDFPLSTLQIGRKPDSAVAVEQMFQTEIKMKMLQIENE